MINQESLLKNEKNSLRKKVLDIRESFNSEDIAEKSKTITKKIIALDFWKKSNFLMSYVDFRNEVITRDLIKTSLLTKKRVAIPVVAKINIKNELSNIRKKKIIPFEIKNIELELEKGNFGILEPKREYRREIDIKDLDLIIVPGIAFDSNKNRLGFGAGYYDVFLKDIAKQCLTIGIAFEAQMVDNVPVEGHDIPLDIIITEKRVIV